MECLMLYFEAPLMSFGTTQVDKYGATGLFPCRSMLTGLLANALGYKRTDIEKLSALQARLSYAARCDQQGTLYRDFQSTRIALKEMQTKGIMTSAGWADPGRNDQWRKKGQIFLRYRDYWTDAAYLVAIALHGEGEVDHLSLEQALRKPARTLSIGRACCIPTSPLFYGRRETSSLYESLLKEPHAPRSDASPTKRAIWPVSDGGEGTVVQLYENKDWRNSVHTGQTRMREGTITLGGASC